MARFDSKINSIKLRQSENDILVVSNNNYLSAEVDEELASKEEPQRKLCQCKYDKTAVGNNKRWMVTRSQRRLEVASQIRCM